MSQFSLRPRERTWPVLSAASAASASLASSASAARVPASPWPVSVGVDVGRPTVEVRHLVQTELSAGFGEGTPQVIIRHVIVADAGVQPWVVVIVQVDHTVSDRPCEAVVLILVRPFLVVIHLSAYPVVGVCIVGDETDVGVVGVESIGASPVGIVVVHAEVAAPFARERHRLVRVFVGNAGCEQA